ncbi:MAG: 4'-phosphopantetheinyl transferase family protein [Planctomycetota bacterium]
MARCSGQPPETVFAPHAAEERLSCTGDTVHIWGLDLDVSDAAIDALYPLLDQEERERAARYRFITDRNRFVVRRSLLRKVLARYLETEASRVRLQTGIQGRPELADYAQSTITFSVSHSQGRALIAVASTADLGVDLEAIRPLADLRAMIDRCLSSAEKDELYSLPAELQLERFYGYWTCKEAYLKALGVGLSRALDSICIKRLEEEVGDCGLIKDGGIEVRALAVWSFTPWAGYVAATVTRRVCTCHQFFALSGQ